MSKLAIKCIVFKYDEATRKLTNLCPFQEEQDFIVHSEKRNNAIAPIVSGDTKKNVLVVTDFHNKKKHVDLLQQAILKQNPSKSYTICKGTTDIEQRREIRLIAEKLEGIVIIATYEFSQQEFQSRTSKQSCLQQQGKAIIKVLQTIGRGLRLDGKTNTVTVFDISSDFLTTKNAITLLKHLFERSKYMLQSSLSSLSQR